MNAEGWVLAGGRSLRMGRDKAGIMLAGRPLLGHMLEKLRALGLRSRVAGLRQTIPEVAVEVFGDAHPDCGPLSGMETALAASERDRVLLLSVDLPFVEPEFLAWMLARAETTDAIATVPRVAGEPQPLCGVYRREMISAVRESLEQGDFKAMHAVERSSAAGRIDLFDAETLLSAAAWRSRLPVHVQFMNCNTPEDLMRAEEVLSAGSML
jgi:molybdenum cofactor guanylyltransferase